MPNLSSILNDQIRRLARREITSSTRVIRRATAQYRRDIAALKRQVSAMRKVVAFLEAQEKQRVVSQPPSGASSEDVRFRADGLRSHRRRLGLSAKDFARLIGVSALSIYNWETGRAKPRKQQVIKLSAIRNMGKREAAKRLQLMD